MQDVIATPDNPADDLPSREAAGAAAPAKALAKVVYLIASHVNPDQIVRLVNACRTGSPQSRVLVHHDYNCSYFDPKLLEGMERVDLLEGHFKVEWGRYSQLLPAMRSIDWLLKNQDFDWVVLLSGQDYPIQPLSQIETFLTETPYDGFLDVNPADEVSWLNGAQRYYYQYYELPKFKGWSHLRNLIRSRAEDARAAGRQPRWLIPQDTDPRFRIGYRPFRGLFRNGFKCWFGSAWWTINRRASEHLLRYSGEHPELKRWYDRTLFAVNESFPQTILMNNPALKFLSNDEKRYVTWHDHQETGHPDVLTSKDFDAMIASGDHFCRKVNQAVDPKLLDMLDEHIGVRR